MAKPALVPAQPSEQPAILQRAELAVASEQSALVAAESTVAALARQLNYQGSTDPAVLENSARDAIRRIGAGIFELGGYLLLLKQACEHGNFLPALERLGIGIEASRRYMQIAKRFANSSTSRNLEALGMSKLVELLPLDDDQTMDLAELGQTGELALDDVARMSVKELRAAVRKERTVRQRQEDVNRELNAEVVRLKLDHKVVAHTDWPDALVPVTDQVAAAGRKLATALSELQTCRITLFEHAQALGDEERASFEAALAHVAEVYEEALARAERGIERERVTFDKTLGAFGDDGAALAN